VELRQIVARSPWLAGVCLALLLWPAAHGVAAQPVWKPADPVELIVGQGAGGNTDIYARLFQNLFRDQRIVTAPVNVVNKAGGGGSVGMTYLSQRPADGHALFFSNATLLTSHIVGRVPTTYTGVTPISLLAQEYVAFGVPAASPIKSGKELLARLKQDPASISLAIGAAVGNQNHIAVALVAKAAGANPRQLKTVIFKSGGETMTAILGGHVDVGMTSSRGFAKHVQAGTLRVIAVAAPQRLEGPLASVPTWKELGVDAVAGNWYAVVGPKGMPSAPVHYWENAFASAVKTSEWKQYVKNEHATEDFLGSEATAKFFKAEYEKLKGILSELGLVK
jgi:putative tricarboxylic transport membrane protein